ncbi:MAG: type II toxin-antitoxin system VapC family toxin [Candidatus Bathyarchaeia archaeon]
MDKGRQGEKLRIVIDASVIAKWIIPGEPWEEQAKLLRNMVVSGDVEAYVPTLLLYEVTSVILRAFFRGVLKLSDGIEALKALRYIGFSIKAIEWEDLVEILNIATAAKLTVYDSTYIYLAKKLNAQLVTADRQMKKSCENITRATLLEELNGLSI